MSDVIKLLPDSVANQIAAGEVIQRPASVIKELVENSVDAGAKSIKIILRDAGKNLIQVVDDGCGMSDTDARLAFERHATSKIRHAADLFELHTMGFRGEALPSIAAVAQIDLRTMRKGDSVGTHVEIAASKVESQTPEVCVPGTNLSVKNLFFNFPARRKFLKKDSVELSHIVHEFERLALVNPHLEFLLVHNDVTLHQLLPSSLKKRIADLFGKSLDRQLIPVDTDTALVKITGFVSLPENARKRNALQYFFVNGRNMRHPYFHKAVMTCYEDLIPSDQQPNYFLNLEVDPQTIDVNIHPTKSEIKFENELAIWQIIIAAVKESLGKFNAGPAIDFNVDDAPEIPAFNPDATADFEAPLDPGYNPFATPARTAPVASGLNLSSGGQTSAPSAAGAKPSAMNWRADHNAATSDWEKLYEGFMADSPLPSADIPAAAPWETPAASGPSLTPATDIIGSALNTPAATADPSLPSLPEMGAAESPGLMQLANRYIITPSRDGLMVIDRHRAHIKVLYERYNATMAASTGNSQQVLFPETVTLSASQNVILRSITDDLRAIGFELTESEGNQWSIDGIPSALGDQNPSDTLLKIISDVEDGGEVSADDMKRKVVTAMARAAAIRPGQPLTAAEADKLLASLLSLPDPTFTPDGHRIITLITPDELSSRLG